MMKFEIDNEVRVIEPTKEFRKWVIDNYRMNNPEYSKKQNMGFSTRGISKTISLFREIGGDIILPFGTIREINKHFNKEFQNNDIKIKVGKRVQYDVGNNLELYEYQQKAVEKLIEAKFGILKAPAGCGKTQIGIALACKLKCRTLWLTHTQDLLNQSYSRAKQFIDSDFLGKITEGKVNVGEFMTFATVQTMSKLDLSLLKNEFDLIIVDECHRVFHNANKMGQFSKIINGISCLRKIGLSATVHRADGLTQGMFALMGKVVHEISEKDAEQRIMQLSIRQILTNYKISTSCLDYDGTIIYSKLLTNIAENQERNKLILQTLVKEQENYCLVLSDRILQLEYLQEKLESVGLESKILVGKTPKKEREEILENARNGKINFILSTYALAKEGLDVPILNRLFFATPQSDFAIVTQSVGRIARIAEGKKDSVVIDFVDKNSNTLLKKYKKRVTHYKKLLCKFE